MDPYVVTLAIVVMFLSIQLTLDLIQRRRIAAVRRSLLTVGRQVALQTSCTVILKESDRPEQIVEELDALRRQGYPLLQIILLSVQPNIKRYSPYLQRYKRTHPELNIRIVRSAKRDDLTLLTRHASANLVVWLPSFERLSNRFFERIAYEFTDNTLQRLSIPVTPVPTGSLTSLIATWQVLRRRSAIQIMPGLGRQTDVTVIRRTTRPGHMNIKAQNARLAIAVGVNRNLRNRWYVPLINIYAALLGALLVIEFIQPMWLLAVYACIATYMLINLFIVLNAAAYTSSQKLWLLLMLPFAAIGTLAVQSRTLR